MAKVYPELTLQAIDFFTCEEVNPQLFEEVKMKCAALAIKRKSVNAEHMITLGFLSVVDFSDFLLDRGYKEGIPSQGVDYLLKAFVDNGIVTEMPYQFQQWNPEKRFKVGGKFAKYLYDRDLILTTVCGWQYIVDKYTNSVFKIEHINDQNEVSIGTGFYFAAKNDKLSKQVIVTNRHVVEKAKTLRVFDKNDAPISFKGINCDPVMDIAFIILDKFLPIPSFHFNNDFEMLMEIITMGYPSVPMSKLAYQLVHKGEINSYIHTFDGSSRLVFSAKTSSGNSGSPIIDKYGMVIGIVAEELFEREQFYEKGKLPYYAGIPSKEIIRSFNSSQI